MAYKRSRAVIDALESRRLLSANVGLTVVEQTGDDVPGLTGEKFGTESIFNNFTEYPPQVNASGHRAFIGTIETSTNVDSLHDVGLFATDNNGNTALIARGKVIAPWTSSETYRLPTQVTLTNNNHVVFFSFLDGPAINVGNDEGIFEYDGAGHVTLLVREGEEAPGVPGTAIEHFLIETGGVYDFTVNDNGDIAFGAQLSSGNGVDSTNNTGIWELDSSGALLQLVRAGDAAPSGGTFNTSFSMPALNGSRELVFWNFNKLYDMNADGMTSVLYTTSNHVPSVSVVTMVQPALNNRGDVAFELINDTATPIDSLYEIPSLGQVKTIATVGDTAPGVTGGTFGVSSSYTVFSKPSLASNGTLAFQATLAHGGLVNDNNDSGIWREDSDGGLHLLARTGDVAPSASQSVFKTLSAPAFNVLGETAFYATTSTLITGIWGTGLDDVIVPIAVKDQPFSNVPGFNDTVNLVGGILSLTDGGQTGFQVELGNNTANVIATLRASPIVSGVFTIDGTTSADTISVSADTDNNLIAAVVNREIISAALDQAISVSVAAGEGNDSVTIGSHIPAASVLGGAGDDTIIGGDSADTLTGAGGNDSIRGALGGDSLAGGGGNDILSGNAGGDTLRSGAGNDLLKGGPDNDSLAGGADTDTLTGGAGNDILNGGIGSDNIAGGPDDDQIYAGDQEADTIIGGAGNDTAHSDSADTVPNHDVESVFLG